MEDEVRVEWEDAVPDFDDIFQDLDNTTASSLSFSEFKI
jgi:hypothetical protein